jgi:ABC-type uncharacterized transport system
VLALMLLSGAADRPRVALLTALPLVWGEGDAGALLTGGAGRSATLKALDREFEVRAIDTISMKTLGRDVMMIAQPRRLAPQELATFDKWVRHGGRSMIFADPELLWPSRHAPGDARRAPPVTLLDPLFKHWGVTLGDSDRSDRIAKAGALTIATAGAGTWTGPRTCVAPDPLVLHCSIGKGRVILVGDADMLDERLWQRTNADNPDWIAAQLRSLGVVIGASRADSEAK